MKRYAVLAGIVIATGCQADNPLDLQSNCTVGVSRERIRLALDPPCRYVSSSQDHVEYWTYPGIGDVYIVAGAEAPPDRFAHHVDRSEQCTDKAQAVIRRGETLEPSKVISPRSPICPHIGLDEIFYRDAVGAQDEPALSPQER